MLQQQEAVAAGAVAAATGAIHTWGAPGSAGSSEALNPKP